MLPLGLLRAREREGESAREGERRQTGLYAPSFRHRLDIDHPVPRGVSTFDKTNVLNLVYSITSKSKGNREKEKARRCEGKSETRMRGRQSGEMVARWTMFAVGTMVRMARAAATAVATTQISRVRGGWFRRQRRGDFVYDRLNLFAVVRDFSLRRSRVDGFFRLCERDSHKDTDPRYSADADIRPTHHLTRLTCESPHFSAYSRHATPQSKEFC